MSKRRKPAWNKGLSKHTDERVAKYSKKRPPRTKEWYEKQRASHLGKKMPPSFYEKMAVYWAIPNSGQFKKGQKPKNYGVRSGKYTISRWHPDYEYAISVKPDCCEVCFIPESELSRKLSFDHSHTTNRFRGWLCGRCNLALGYAGDSEERLRALADYLKKTHER